MKIRAWWWGVVALFAVALIGWTVLRSDDTGKEARKSTADAKPDTRKSNKPKRPKDKKPPHPPAKVELPPIPGLRKLPQVTDEQLDRFLTDNRRSPAAMLAAYRIKGDIALLREAAAAHPEHAGIQLEMALRGGTPEEKRAALELFRKLEPDNSLGDYLSAAFHFQQGNTEEALKDVSLADSRTKFDNHQTDATQCVEDAYLSAGKSLAEARAAAMFGMPVVSTMSLSLLAGKLSDLQGQHLKAGDTDSAETLCKTGLSLAAKARGDSKLLINDLVGMAIESRFLKQLPPESIVPGTNLTAAARLQTLADERQQVAALTGKSNQLQSSLSENELIAYLKKVTQVGELNALRSLEENPGR